MPFNKNKIIYNSLQVNTDKCSITATKILQ